MRQSERKARRSADHALSVLHMDLDRFKDINDTLGHAAGDNILRHAAHEIAGLVWPVAVLFGEPDAHHAVTRDTRTIRLYSLQVAGVPDIHVEEAFWTALDAAWPDETGGTVP